MIEPLLGIALPNGIVMSGKYHRTSDSVETVVVLEQVFDNVRAQENLATVCKLCATQAGIRLVAVEGDDGEVRPARAPQSVRDLIGNGTPVSAGILSLQQTEPDLIDVCGVDEMKANHDSQRAMIAVRQSAAVSEAGFGALRPLLSKAQARCYGPDVAAVRSAMLGVYGSPLPLARQHTLLVKAIANAGIDLGRFPLVRRFHEMRSKEAKVSAWRAKTQMVRFVSRVRQRLFNWFKRAGKNQVEIDLEKVKPVLQYWMEVTGLTPAELDANAERRGFESVLLECKRWLESWLTEEAQRQGAQGTSFVYFEELMRIALRLEVDYFDLRDFRELIAINRDTDSLKRGLLDEMVVASRALVASLPSPDAAKFLELEERFDLFWRALHLAVPPGEAEAAGIDAGRLQPLVDELVRLAGEPLPPAVNLAPLDAALGEAATFLRLSKQRSQHMADRTLELMRERGEDRAMLVVGGFHERAITRALEDARGVSWSVLAPSPDLSEARA